MQSYVERDTGIAILSACLSVCLSVCRLHSGVVMRKPIIVLPSGISVFQFITPKRRYKIPTGSSITGALNTVTFGQ